MRLGSGIVLSLAAASATFAASFEPFPTFTSENITVQNRVSQFSRLAGAPWLQQGDGKVVVDPTALLVSAGRIKRALLQSLDLSPRGGDAIRFIVAASPFGVEEMRISQGLFTEGWLYDVMVPDRLTEFEIIRGVVHVLLLEVANRGGRTRSAEIPEWLIEGLAMNARTLISPDVLAGGPRFDGTMLTGERLLLGGAQVQLNFAPFDNPMSREYGANDLLREARDFLRQEQPLTLDELRAASLARGDALDRQRFHVCAQLLVTGLLNLPDGRKRLAQMLRALPQSWNWELTFFEAYRPYFPQPLDLEKWWWVNLNAFTGRDPAQILSVESGLDKLESILKPAVKIWGATNELPARENITLKQLLTDWDFAAQRLVLEKTLADLTVLQANCTRALAPVVQGYRTLLQGYLRTRTEAARSGAARIRPTVPPELIVGEVFAGLDQLYLQRERLRRESDLKQAQARSRQ